MSMEINNFVKGLIRESAVSDYIRTNSTVVFKLAACGMSVTEIREYLGAFCDLGGRPAIRDGAELALMRLGIGFPVTPPSTMEEAVALAEDVTAHYTMRQLFIPDESQQDQEEE